MPVSTSALVPRVFDLLADQPNRTTSTTTGTGTTVVIPDTTMWSAGDIGEWQTGTVGYEQFLVTTVVNGTDLTVVRGYNGTTAETHTSGDAILQNPTYTGRQVQQALNDAVRALWPFVYTVESKDITPVAGQVWYNVTGLTGTAVGLVQVTQQYGASPGLLYGRFGGRNQPPVVLDLNADVSVAASGKALYLPSLFHPTNTIKAVFQTLVTGTSDIEDSSEFPVADAVVYLAAGKVVAATEAPRVGVGADLSTSGTVTVGSRSSAGAGFMGEGKRRLELLAIKYRLHYRPYKGAW